MKRLFLFLTMLSIAVLALADDQTQAVQQALKDQGFFYGTVDGQPGPETDAAVRRYQIRQGLQVSGKLDAATLSSLNIAGSAPADSASQPVPPPPGVSDSTDSQPAAQQTPAPDVVQSDHDILRSPTPVPPPPGDMEGEPPDRTQPQPETEQPQPEQPPVEQPEPPPAVGPGGVPLQPFYGGAPVRPVVPVAPVMRAYSYFFRKTPFETAPPAVQVSTVRMAQMRLGRQGFYRGPADGQLNDQLSRALAAYQHDSDLRTTGRLDMQTLEYLNLLPAREMAPPRAVYQGVWVH